MNKMIKLPLFLGVIGGLCGGLLALTNYFTHDKIEKDDLYRKNAALYVHFDNTDKVSDEITLSDPLIKAGVVQKNEAFDSSNNSIGMIYTCSVNGYVDKISFQISFSNGDVHKFLVTESKETDVGAQYIASLSNVTDAELKSSMYDTEIKTTYTKNAVVNCVNACSQDYLTSLGA